MPDSSLSDALRAPCVLAGQCRARVMGCGDVLSSMRNAHSRANIGARRGRWPDVHDGWHRYWRNYRSSRVRLGSRGSRAAAGMLPAASIVVPASGARARSARRECDTAQWCCERSRRSEPPERGSTPLTALWFYASRPGQITIERRRAHAGGPHRAGARVSPMRPAEERSCSMRH
jgi:hypothetical protein